MMIHEEQECKVGQLTLDLIIPTYKPDEKFDQILHRLAKQSVTPRTIFVINTEEQYLAPERYQAYENVKVMHITREEFDHGGTRNYGATLSDADILMFMTQDAVPADHDLIRQMLLPFADQEVATVYARQLANEEAGVIERYTRVFNYPDQDCMKAKKDLPVMGIKTYFCSNACAAYRKSIYEALGGFVTKTIFNEDMIMASKVIGQGYKIAYASKARVVHSHRYTYREQFTRNFDLAVSQKQYSEIFSKVKSESEGIRLVKQTAGYLMKTGRFYLIPDLILQSGFKFLGYKCGIQYDRFPLWLVKKMSMNKAYWKDR